MGEHNSASPKELSKEFLSDYRQMCEQFDKIEHETLFKGSQMELLTRKFLDKHRAHMRAVSKNTLPDEVRCLVRYDLDEIDERSWSELLQDDRRVLQSSIALRPDKIEPISYKKRDENEADEVRRPPSDSITLSPPDINLLESTREPHELIADVYRRACEACYLRVTFNKVRLRQEDDRREPVRFAQQAIRHDPNSFKACYFYMISSGWYLDGLSIISGNVKERILGGESFKASIMRCIQLNPQDALSHHLLGRYYYHVASLTWLARSVARNLLNMELEGDYEAAERELRRAHELYDNWLPTGLWLARVILARGGRRDEIEDWIKWSVKLDAREPTTEIERQELLELAKKLKVNVASTL